MSSTATGHVSFWSADDVDVDELRELVDTTTPPETYPHASMVHDEIVVYDMASVAAVTGSSTGRAEVVGEIAHALDDGPGVVAMRNAVALESLARATDAFEAMIEEQRRSNSGPADHFAVAGANDRIWNALEKLAVEEPGVFVDYYASQALALASYAWLGPGYQVTSQINVVNPGGDAQSPHRDYHLGFMTDEQASRYPARVHLLSPKLTLQGAVAHVDMPVEAGPTKLLPHSQKYPLGYLAWRRPEVIELFEQRHRQPTLAAGDAVFFNPAVLHAAGSNRTADVRRMGNLLQVSSPFGRQMESMDRTRMVRAIYPELVRRRDDGWSTDELERAVAAAAEGYAFPTNLDHDPPTDGLAPPTQADLVHTALAERWSPERLDDALTAHDAKRSSV